jgi:F-type H+-transporting ATPase subunit epsilon
MSDVATRLRVEMVTPIGPVATGDVDTDAVTAPGALGELEIFVGHVPFLTELHAGVLTLGEDGPKSRYAVGPGFLEVTAAGEIKILVERAVPGSEVDLTAAEAERAETEPTVKGWKGGLDAEFLTLKARYEWALAKIQAHALSS